MAEDSELENDTKYLGRKFSLVLVVFFVTAVLAFLNEVPMAVFQDLVQYLLGAYLLGNVAQTVVPITELEQKYVSSDYSRKFVLVVLVFLVTCGLKLLGVVSADVYLNVSYWVVGGYIAGNVSQKALVNGVQIAGFTFRR